MKLIKKLLLSILIIIIVISSIFILNGKKMYENIINETSLEDTVNSIKTKDSYVTLSDVPNYYIDAVIAVEDHRYKSHGPIDIIAIRTSYFYEY